MRWLLLSVALAFLIKPAFTEETFNALSKWPIAEEYRAAGVSITNLHAFIAKYPDQPGWCGEAQITIARLERRHGDNEKSLISLRRAIEKYGETDSPIRSIKITVSDLAHADMARLLQLMGQKEEAEKTLTKILNDDLRESMVVQFLKEKNIRNSLGNCKKGDSMMSMAQWKRLGNGNLKVWMCVGCLCVLGLCASIADEVVYATQFNRDGWRQDEWIMVKSPRWTHIGEWVQQDDHVHNLLPPDAVPDKLVGSSQGCAYMSMVRSEPYEIGKGLSITARMEFDYDQGPQIVLATALGKDGNGYPEYRDHYEVVLFARGINIWRHTFNDDKPEWVLSSYGRFPLERRTPYNLKVSLEPVSSSRGNTTGSMIVVSVDGENIFAYHEPTLPDTLYVGIIGYASLNRFYSFKVEKK